MKMGGHAHQQKEHKAQGTKQVSFAFVCAVLILLLPACANMKKVFGVKERNYRSAPIANPFQDYYYPEHQRAESIILRTREGDRSTEVEIPGTSDGNSQLVIPLSGPLAGQQVGPSSLGRSPAGSLMQQYGTPYYSESPYSDVKPSISDREITRTFGQAQTKYAPLRDEIERQLGVVPAEDEVPEAEWSYLAAVDHVKNLYRLGRYEAALLEVDKMLRAYPTDPRLYEMRGTLFDRLGKPDLAMRSWNQALRFDPANQSLRKFIERKQVQRGVAGGVRP